MLKIKTREYYARGKQGQAHRRAARRPLEATIEAIQGHRRRDVQQISSESLYSHQQSVTSHLLPPLLPACPCFFLHIAWLSASLTSSGDVGITTAFSGSKVSRVPPSSPKSTVPNSTKQRNVTAAPRELITNVELQIGLDKHAVAVMLHQVTLTAFFIVYGDLLTSSYRRLPPTSSTGP